MRKMLLTMLTAKRLAGTAPKVNLRNPCPGFKTPGSHHQKSKTEAPQKGFMSANIFFNKLSTKLQLRGDKLFVRPSCVGQIIPLLSQTAQYKAEKEGKQYQQCLSDHKKCLHYTEN